MNSADKDNFRIFSLGENAVTIEFGNAISERLNRRVLNLAKYFENNPFSGLIEVVPAYASLTCFFDVFVVKHTFANFPTAFEAVENLLENAAEKSAETAELKNKLVEIPVSFEKKFALDLEFVASANNLSEAEVIEIFTSQIYRVFMLGFLPGFAYLGEVDERISVSRKPTPRLKVPMGSVGIAGRQTGIYPLESPGGWQIIGRTDLPMFDLKAENPCLLQVGDSVKFYDDSL